MRRTTPVVGAAVYVVLSAALLLVLVAKTVPAVGSLERWRKRVGWEGGALLSTTWFSSTAYSRFMSWEAVATAFTAGSAAACLPSLLDEGSMGTAVVGGAPLAALAVSRPVVGVDVAALAGSAGLSAAVGAGVALRAAAEAMDDTGMPKRAQPSTVGEIGSLNVDRAGGSAGRGGRRRVGIPLKVEAEADRQ